MGPVETSGRRRVRAFLKGYECQHFPSDGILKKFTKIYDVLRLDDKNAESIGRLVTIFDFKGVKKSKTDDGYHWACGLEYEAGKGRLIDWIPIIGKKRKIRALFPKPGDDRHITFFTDGNVTGEEVDKLAESLYDSINTVFRFPSSELPPE